MLARRVQDKRSEGRGKRFQLTPLMQVGVGERRPRVAAQGVDAAAHHAAAQLLQLPRQTRLLLQRTRHHFHTQLRE